MLAYGAHNQFPAIALAATRREFLDDAVASSPSREMREFLGGRHDGAARGAVDGPRRHDEASCRAAPPRASPTSSTSRFGEQILLTVRARALDESTVTGGTEAAAWAQAWRNEHPAVRHAYRAATGVDLQGARRREPSTLLARRSSGARVERACTGRLHLGPLFLGLTDPSRSLVCIGGADDRAARRPGGPRGRDGAAGPRLAHRWVPPAGSGAHRPCTP